MLQNVRDNMKGTVAVIVVMLFVIPMVLTGMSGSSFLSSVAGTDAAKVNQRKISKSELTRAVYQQRERLKGQGMDAASEQLSDENLRGPVLQGLTQQAALISVAEDAGMGVSDKQIYSTIQSLPRFQVDGVFNKDQYRQQISYEGHTPTTYKEYIGDILLVQQKFTGLNSSSFVTEVEVDAMVAISHEKRSFETIQLPVKDLEADISVSAEEVEAYYQGNQPEFVEPEKMSIQYVELSVDLLAQSIELAEEVVLETYNAERDDFYNGERSSEVQIAHLMLDKNADDVQQTIATIKQRIAAGEEFAALVKEFSIDEGSKETGGDLGVLISGTFSEEFEAAALALAEGDVSDAVETDSGLHLIKSLARKVEEFPSFEDKRVAIESQLKRAQAEEMYANLEPDFEDLAFNASDLQLVSDSLGLSIRESGLFERSSGAGITSNKVVRDAAWADEVLLDSRNSPKIQIAAGHAVVVRKKDHVAEHVIALDIVSPGIETKLKAEKVATQMRAKAAAVIADIRAGTDAQSLAEAQGYTYAAFDKVKRFEAQTDYQVREAAFNLAAGEGVSFDSVRNPSGEFTVVVLGEVIKGERADMPEQQIDVLTSQLERENTMAEIAAYQAQVLADSSIKIY